MKCFATICLAGALATFTTAYSQPVAEKAALPRVLAVETFMADIAQNVAGDRLHVETLIPLGADPHSYEPSPVDVRQVAQCQVLIVNGARYEEFLDRLLKNAGGEHLVIEASKGLVGIKGEAGEGAPAAEAVDPHFWLDPSNVVKYAQNIRDGLSQADPAGAAVYARNAESYIAELKKLDEWAKGQAARVPPERRVLVTSHECFAYFARHFGFKVIGTIIPSVSTEAQPSARQIAELVDLIRATHAPAVFIEPGTNAQLADQIARETGVKVVTDLYLESLSDKSGPAPTYLDLIRHDVKRIVETLSPAPK